MLNTYTIHCLSEALSPITHMAGTEGNNQVLMREPVMTPQGLRGIPQLTGNMLRHRLIRESAADYVVERWGLAGQLTTRQANFLYHGGQLTDSTGRISTADIAAAFDVLPMIRLLGGCLTNQILPGSLIVWHGSLVCREHADRLSRVLPDGVDVPASLRPAQEFEGRWQYNRQDAARSVPSLIKPTAEADDTALMLFAGDSVVPGSCFAHGFVAQNVSEIETGCLLHSLMKWMAGNSSVGGQSSRGHGRLATMVHVPDSIAAATCVQAYVDHVDAKCDAGRAWLDTTFGALKLTKPTKASKAAS